jgi:hypothetical protein
MIPPVGPVLAVLVVAAPRSIELIAAALFVAGAGLKAIGWELVMLGFTGGGAFGGITRTFTNGGFALAQERAWRLVSKNLSITIALRS